MSKLFFLSTFFVGLQLALAQSNKDEQCKDLKAEAYAPFTKIDHGGVAFIVEDVKLYGALKTHKTEAREVKAQPRNNTLTNLPGYLSTTAPLSSQINLPASVACSIFKACSSGYIRHNCFDSFCLGFKLGGKWFYAPSEALIDKPTKDANNQCQLNLYALEDERLWLGRAFLDYHCTFDDRDGFFGVAKIPVDPAVHLNDKIWFDLD